MVAAHLKLKLMVEMAHPKFLVFLNILTEHRMVAAHLKLKVEMAHQNIKVEMAHPNIQV